jgi:hypothetical protein
MVERTEISYCTRRWNSKRGLVITKGGNIMTNNNKYSHHELCKESNLSFALLKEIMDEEDLTVKGSIIHIFDTPMADTDDKILLIFNNDSLKLRRKNKGKYTYFNAFKNKDHLDFIIDKMNEYNDEIDCITIEETNKITGWYSVKLMNIHNKVMKEIQVFDVENFNKEKSILRLLLTYYNIVF